MEPRARSIEEDGRIFDEDDTDLTESQEFDKSLAAGSDALQRGDAAGARSYLEKALRYKPRNQRARNLLGLSLFKLGELEKAESLYRGLIEDHPADPTLRVNLGLVFLKSGAAADAVRCFETSLDLQPDHAKSQNYLGLALAQKGEHARAREWFRKCGNEPMAERMTQALAASPIKQVAQDAERSLEDERPFRSALADAPAAPAEPGAAAEAPPAPVPAPAAPAADAAASPPVPAPDAAAPASPVPDLPAPPPASQWVASVPAPVPLPGAAPLPEVVPAVPLGRLQLARRGPTGEIIEEVPGPGEGEPESVRVAAEAAAASPSSPPAAPSAPLPPPPLPTLLDYSSSRRLVAPAGDGAFVVGPTEVTVQVRVELLTRLDGLVACFGAPSCRPELKRFRGKATDKPFGEGARRMLRVAGEGRFIISREGRHFTALELGDEPAYFREEILFAFEEALVFENGRVPSKSGADLHLVHLRGKGQLLLCTAGDPRAVDVKKGEPLRVPMDQLVGWHGPLLQPRLIPIVDEAPEMGIALELSGEGRAIVDAPEERD